MARQNLALKSQVLCDKEAEFLLTQSTLNLELALIKSKHDPPVQERSKSKHMLTYVCKRGNNLHDINAQPNSIEERIAGKDLCKCLLEKSLSEMKAEIRVLKSEVSVGSGNIKRNVKRANDTSSLPGDPKHVSWADIVKRKTTVRLNEHPNGSHSIESILIVA